MTPQAAYKVYTEQPYNAGAAPSLLREQLITPRNLFFARNHGTIPVIDAASYRFEVGGLVERPLMLSLDDLRRDFPSAVREVTLTCAGSRRDELEAMSPVAAEVKWDGGAISNGEWRGVPLRHVLLAAGIAEGAAHVEFVGLDAIEKHGHTFGFGGSIPLELALSGEVLLAYEMNGEPLPVGHGFPLRTVVPGYIGARSVKWLAKINVLREQSQNYYQSQEYKLFPPQVTAATVDWSTGVNLNELCLNSVICTPLGGAVVDAHGFTVEGYAIAGGNTMLDRVEISADGGQTWQPVRFESQNRKGAWRFWSAQLATEPGEHQLVVRATDTAGGTQPEHLAEVWNFKGYQNNAWHRVTVRAE
jgi:sulfite oxidase